MCNTEAMTHKLTVYRNQTDRLPELISDATSVVLARSVSEGHVYTAVDIGRVNKIGIY